MIANSTRRRLLGSIAFLATSVGMAQSAQAQDECGVIPAGGSVTCTSAGNPYADGIFYVAFGDATINLDSDVFVVDNSATDNAGLFAIIGDNGNLTINGAAGSSITTVGNNAVGVQTFTNAGNLTASLGNVSTTGTGGGIQAGASDGNVSVTADTVSTLGAGADAVEVTTNNGDVTVDVGTVTTAGDGANGVRARSDFGDVSVTADSITTTGNQSGFIDPGANGILAQTSGAGTLTVDAGTITTSGTGAIGIRASNNTGAMTIDADTITTTGAAAEGISVVSAGAVDIGAGTVSTAGAGANGIQAQSTGSVLIDFDSVTTTGDNSVGVLVPQGALFFGPRFTPNVTITGGDVTTSGMNSDGVRAIASTGTSSVTLDGTVTTTGNASRGIVASGTTGASVSGPFTVSTSGLNAIGVGLTSAGTINFSNVGGSVTTTGDGSAGILAAGTVGPVTINSGTVDVSGTGSTAISSTTTTGAQMITASGAVTSDNGDAIATTSTTGNQTIQANSAISAGGVGILANSTDGNIGITNTAAITTAGNSIDAAATGTGSVTVNRTGASVLTSTGGDGIQADTTTGAINVTTGAISAGAGDAVQTTSTTGNQTVGVTGNISGLGGVNAFSSGGGTIGVNLTGGADVNATGGDGIYVDSSAAKTVTIGAGSVVTATNRAIFGSGASTLTVNNSGTVGSAGGIAVYTNGATAASVNNLTGGTLNGRVDLSSFNDTITNAGIWNVDGVNNFYVGSDLITNQVGGVVNVAAGTSFTGLETLNNAGTVNAATGLTFDAGATAVTNTGMFNASGAIDFGAGVDSLANNAGGTFNATGATTLAGLETLSNAGTFNAATGLTFDGGDTAVTNTGTFNAAGTLDFGAGTDSFANNAAGTFNVNGATTLVGLETLTNAGRINLNTFTLTGTGAFTNTGTIDTNGSAGLAGFTALNNAGTLDLAAGTFNAPAGVPFANSGTIIADEGATTITGQTSFTNAATGIIDLQDGATGDVLTLNSSYAGTAGSRLQIDASDTLADQLVVTGAISGTTAVDANLIGTGAIIDTDLLVVDGQTTSTPNAFVLGTVSGNASPLVDYSITQAGSDYFLSSSLNDAAFDPMVVSSLIPQLWYPSADEIFANLAVPYKGDGVGFWGQAYYGRDKYGERDDTFTVAGVDYTVDDRVKHSRFGLQTGVDFGLSETGRVGITAGYGWHKLRGATDLDANGWNIGAYGAFGGPTGFHGEALVKHDRYKPDFSRGAFDGYGSKIRSTGVDGSLGYRIPMGGENASLDLAAGLSHVWNKVDDIDAYGIRYSFDNFDSTRGRASARYNLGGDLQPYVSGTVYHEFADGGSVALFDGSDTYTLDSRQRGTWGRIEGGIGGSPNRFPTLAAWADLGDVKGFGARLGMRFGGSSEAAPPPPPPPPPPAPVEAPPATQTCYDGSTILATDTCPVPPPPPPPAPMPERG